MDATENDVRLRLRLQGPVTPAQLRCLRAVFPPLAVIPPAALRQRLSTCSYFVVGSVAQTDSTQALARLCEAGLNCSLTERYDVDYVRRILQAPPAWASAKERGEVVFMPSFSPELILRFWNDERGRHMHLSRLNVMIGHRHFSLARWLTSTSEEAGPEEVLHEEQTSAPAALASIFVDALPSEAAPTPGYILTDGMPLHVRLEAAGHRAARRFHSPGQSELPEAYAWLMRVLNAASCFTSPESREGLRDIKSYFH